ncbi:MAG: thrombospondin type 3 repeat-containing protein [Dehalococcoidia bacterium]
MTVGLGTATLDLDPALSDELGESISATAVDGEIVVSAGPTATPTDTATPCPGGLCPTETATPTPTSTPVVSCGAPGTYVCIEPATDAFEQGSVFAVEVSVQQVSGLGAFAFTLGFDPSVLDLQGLSLGAFLGSSGRTVNCLAPMTSTGSVAWTCVTLGGAPLGPSGSGTLAILTFSASAVGVSPLDLSDVQLTTISGAPIAAAFLGGVRTVTGCGGACPTNTPTWTFTPAPTATSTPTFTPTSTPCGACPTGTPTPPPPPTNTPGPTLPVVLHVEPASDLLLEMQTVTLDIVADNVQALGGYEIALAFDPAVLSPLSAQDGPLLGSTGRPVSCPIFSSGAGTIRLACVSLGALPAGASGTGVLARFTLQAAATGISAVTFESALVMRVDGAALTIGETTGASIIVDPCPGACPTPTPTNTPAPTQTPGGMTMVGVSPATLAVGLGEEFLVDIVVDGAQNVGSYEVLVLFAFDDVGGFQPGVFEFVEFVDGPFLGSTGRSVSCLPPIVDLMSVRVGCVTSGPSPPGPGGSGVLATLRFRVLNLASRPMQIRVDSSVGGFTDPGGDPLPFSVGGSTTVAVGSSVVLASTPGSGPRMAAALGMGNAGTTGGGPSSRGAGGEGDASTRDVARAVILTLCAAAALLVGVLRSRGTFPSGSLTVSILAVAALVCVSTQSRPSSSFAAGEAAVDMYVSPPSVNVFVGGAPVVVELWLSGAESPGLGSFELEVSYNASLVAVMAQEGPFLATAGSTNCSAQYLSPGQLAFSCALAGGAFAGPTGDGIAALLTITPLASLDLRPTANNAVVSVLQSVKAHTLLHDVEGSEIAVASSGHTLLAVRALEADVNHDCAVSAADEQAVFGRYLALTDEPEYDPALDLEPGGTDGDIDLTDVQFVIGRAGSDCTDPVPAQLAPSPAAPLIDTDLDGVSDALDNCPAIPNPRQQNTDAAVGNGPGIPGDDASVPASAADGEGDACETDGDTDNDGLADASELSPAACAPFDLSGTLHASPIGGDITNDDDGDGNPAPPMGTDAGDDGPSWDTDNDGTLDGWECANGFDPRDAASRPAAIIGDVDSDGDGLRDSWEVRGWGTNPNMLDSDGDGLGDCKEAADVDGNSVVNFSGDVIYFAFAVLTPGFGKTQDFDLDKNGVANFSGDVINAAKFALLAGLCK